MEPASKFSAWNHKPVFRVVVSGQLLVRVEEQPVSVVTKGNPHGKHRSLEARPYPEHLALHLMLHILKVYTWKLVLVLASFFLDSGEGAAAHPSKLRGDL